MPKKNKIPAPYKKYTDKIDPKNPHHVLGTIIFIILAIIAAMWILKALLWIVLIGGLMYLLYLSAKKKKQAQQ